MAVGSIASHQQYLVSMHVLLITAAGCPPHGIEFNPELFIHTNRHKYATTHTHTHMHTEYCIREEAGLLLCLQSFLPLSVSFHPSSLSLHPFSPGQTKGRPSTSPALLFLSLSLFFLASHAHRCLIMDTCIHCSAHFLTCLLCLSF